MLMVHSINAYGGTQRYRDLTNGWLRQENFGCSLLESFLEEIGLEEGQKESIYLGREDGGQRWDGGTCFAKS